MLSDLCVRSKAVWGYDTEFMERCRAELTVTPEMLRETDLRVAATDDRIVGVVQISFDGTDAELDKLFVEPDLLRGGVGRTLLEWATMAAALRGATRLIIDADPGAANFYRRMGGVDAGTAPSASIPGRHLPRLYIPLVPTANGEADSP
ncbi:MAG: GNAT family N-acetyltransferase [Parvibaculum sp.]|nr:GNAT family N-acetyltransferase [Parvibaculum sp.]